jgi:hypothetical protein
VTCLLARAAKDSFHFIGFLCYSVWSTTVEQKQDFLFFGFQSVNQANMANMDALSLYITDNHQQTLNCKED